jgi:acetyl-CoA acetyltransferase
MSLDLRLEREMSDHVAIVGVGETDYAADYRAGRSRAGAGAEAAPLDSYALGLRAFQRALTDSGLRKGEIDGLGVSQLNLERVRELTGLEPLWTGGGLEDAVEAICVGHCTTVALVYGFAQRSQGVVYGGGSIGPTAVRPLHYYYYHPWGFSSQGAHWAMMFRRHQLLYGSTEEELGAVAVAIRKHASLNPNAVMQTPITLADYLSSRYICRPLRLLDYCIVNDGGVALILRRADMSRDLPHTPVLISGFAEASAGRDSAQMRTVVGELQPNLEIAGARALAMAGLTVKDIQHFQAYDASTVNLPILLEGFGFCKRGEGLAFCQDGRIELGGELPCNTSGGMLSESYMQMWNHFAEATRQLRHEAGVRQVESVETSMWGLFMDAAHAIVFRRGA